MAENDGHNSWYYSNEIMPNEFLLKWANNENLEVATPDKYFLEEETLKKKSQDAKSHHSRRKT